MMKENIYTYYGEFNASATNRNKLRCQIRSENVDDAIDCKDVTKVSEWFLKSYEMSMTVTS